jgi:dCMP deaminase
MRPDWDEYGLGIARAVAARADCTRRRAGAVIMKNHRIVATGYNGAPSGEPGCLTDGACPRGRHYLTPKLDASAAAQCACSHSWPCPEAAEPGSSYDTGAGACRALHAEQNALLFADRDKCEGATLYCTDWPCDGCMRMIRGSGILEIVTPEGSRLCRDR